MKTLIFYFSSHHMNTEKLLQGAKQTAEFDLCKVPSNNIPDISAYDRIGFASGVYMSKLGKPLSDLAEKLDLKDKKCFVITTCGSGSGRYGESFADTLKTRGAEICGTFFCKGYDTYAVFGLIGGIAKKHPNDDDTANAVKFISEL